MYINNNSIVLTGKFINQKNETKNAYNGGKRLTIRYFRSKLRK
ncbi:hypothetical protein HMPREF9380_0840 [Streptococcus sanguinis SK49]|uniref:Uncharacterized protein n=2 Tax=Streptococcus sanguinis TaxID=1305 RepID=F2C7E8_STRSA|nr:hypothetical protein HMPREF9386_1033 [Streptococcus sanguinis SK330]EGJ40447.1 hypothetical protein HMPREF9380_0840 [Streptococcus sanguinis SK49]EGJ43709.1 hypothetical protein HMPREF9396_1094 [Streptococcus sanguinis SK1059]EGQ20187.1 hypothetical protein HMPREF8573_1084 [Streptococcus sanguinis ATCC 29667]EGQ23432.1 hypothetical protein HMPREF9387_1637 [Streptococcus sanguinis SK340]